MTIELEAELKSKKTILADQELEIMKVVWRLEETTVRDVYEELLQHRKIAYTTVMTMMRILEQKGHLKRRGHGRAYLYRPTQPKGRVVGDMVQEFIQRVFDGSAKPLLVHLVESDEIDKSEMDEVRRLLKVKRRQK